MNKTKGSLVIVSGFSGAGKGTVVKAITQKYDNYALSISATTRAPRPGELEGREYFFKTREEFEQMIAGGQLIEYAQYVGNYYGTPRKYVEQQLEAGKDVILEIEIQGAMKVKKLIPEALLIFMTPPSANELKNRLEGRGTEAKEVIQSRLERAVEESKGIDGYDYVLINDTIEECVEELHRIIQVSHGRYNQKQELISNIKAELAQIVEKEGR